MKRRKLARYLVVPSLVASLMLLETVVWSSEADKPDDTSQIIHGIEVKDPFRWMEDSGSKAVNSWVADQTAQTADFIKGPQYDAMRARIFELSNFNLRFAPKVRGNRLFYLNRTQGTVAPELRIKENGVDRLILDSENVPDKTMDEAHISGRNFGGTHWPDRVGNLVVYGYNDGISREGKLRIVDQRSGLHLPEEIREVGHGLLSLAWAADGSGFYYYRSRSVDVENGAGTRTRQLGLYFHRLGTPQDDDTAIIEQADGERVLYRPYVSEDGKYLFVSRREGLEAQNSYLVYATKDLSAPITELFAELGDQFRFIGDQGNRLFFQTNYQAENGRVVYVDLDRPNNLVEVIAQTDLPMLVGSSAGGDIIGYAGGHILVGYLKDGVPEVSVFDQSGAFKYVLDLASGKTIWGGIQSVAGSGTITIGTLSALSPSEISVVDVRTGLIEQQFSSPIPIDPDDYIIEHVFYNSKDGTRVPMYVARHKTTRLDGKNPALMYGYGMHKWVSFLFYQPNIMHWMEMGGVYAMPGIRGGGEYGTSWHQAGIKQNRQNAVDDFVAAGRWLIDNSYTSPTKLAANVSSASGPLGGIVAIRHNDVFAASTIDYPVADMVRAPLFGNGALMTEEYGSFDIEAEARAILSQSPYHLAQEKDCRMPTLIMVGELDRVVLPFHGLKLAGAMQQSQSCDKPVLFRMMPEAGHNFGGTPERTATNAAVQLMFLKRVLDF